MGKIIFRTLLFLCVLSLILVVFLVCKYQNDKWKIEDQAREQARTQAEQAVFQINEDFDRLKSVVDAIADDLSSGKLLAEQVVERLKTTITMHRDLMQIGAAYKPYAYYPKKKLYSPGFTNVDGNVKYSDAPYDYTVPDCTDSGPRTMWYHLPMKRGPSWQEPYFAMEARELLAEYGTSFEGIDASNQKRGKIGIIYANFSLKSVRQMVGKLNLGNTGYGFIVTPKGTIVSHPIKEYLGKRIETVKDNTLKEIMDQKRGSRNERAITYVNRETGQVSWIFFLPIPSTDWSIGIVLNKREFLKSAEEERQNCIWILVGTMAFFTFLALIVSRVHTGTDKSLFTGATAISLIFFLGLVSVWIISITAPTDEENLNIVVFDKSGVEAALYRCFDRHPNMIHIPTGVFVQSINFSSANNVIMTGYVWQKYTSEISGKIVPKIILPEAEDINIEEAYQSKTEAGEEIVGWYFRATLRQQFNYSEYPFDREDVWLRLWHGDLNRDVILTPDFDSYDVIHPDEKPGLEKNFVLEGWEIEDCFFSYRMTPYNTKFGFGDHGAKNSCPELYFNVGVKRNFISPFISDMLPLIVVAILVFCVLMISTKSEQKIGLFGFSTSAVLGYCAALFFVLIVSHVHLRESVASHGIIYLEYFYFVMYMAILTVSANSILFASDEGLGFIHYKDNIIIKLLYWPVVMLLLLGITLFVFY